MRRTSWLVLVSLLVVLFLSLSAPTFAAPAAPPNVELLGLNVSTTVAPVADPYTNSNNLAATNVKVLCDGKTFDGVSTPIVVNDTNGSVLKVIRNCKFINTGNKSISSPAIEILAVDNLLIENCTFDNLRTFQPGNDFVAIKFDNSHGAVAKNVVIRGNKFDRIGSDGIQIGANSTKTSNVTIQGNEFIGHDGIGENAIDVKQADGGIVISSNFVHGFRPCNSPKRGGKQDCSGSPGEGIVLHTASAGNLASSLHGVQVTGNRIFDNTIGLAVSGAVDITATNNVLSVNLSTNMSIRNCANCSIQK